MTIDAAVAASALRDTWRQLTAATPGGWIRGSPDAFAAVTGVAVPTLNGVWVDSVDADTRVLAELLGEVAATGLPYGLQARPGSARQASEAAADRGLIPGEQVPLMVLQNRDQLDHPTPPTGLVIRELEPGEARTHALVAASGFEAPVEPFLQLITPEVLGAPGARCYLGEVGDQPVTTGIGVTLGPFVAIFNIATPLAHRGRGYAAAVTARAVADGLTAGATWSWLQSSPIGLSVYERLGFRTVENWLTWVSTTGSG